MDLERFAIRFAVAAVVVFVTVLLTIFTSYGYRVTVENLQICKEK